MTFTPITLGTGVGSALFVDGVLVHQKENKYAGGVNTAVLQLRQVELRADLPDETFIP